MREAAFALADFACDPMELLTACKRLVERRPACAPLVWICARILSGSDPAAEAYDCVSALERDRTCEELADQIPSEASVLVVGRDEAGEEAALWRPDVELVAVDAADDEDHPIGPLVQSVDLLVLEAEAVSDSEALLRSGAGPVVAAARQMEVPVWLVVGLGRVLPEQMWIGATELAMREHSGADSHHGSAGYEVVPLDRVDTVVGPSGMHPVSELRYRRECPIVMELFA
ncbi:MAG: hypothetical protein OXN44_10930 [Acidimicrobiaceae bacterium]|nr:hypothetical protein [Acidimicrobiaceae bacterium]MDE0607316.1 hypothetical protein [Acidimicrobiaceae bacterium]